MSDSEKHPALDPDTAAALIGPDYVARLNEARAEFQRAVAENEEALHFRSYVKYREAQDNLLLLEAALMLRFSPACRALLYDGDRVIHTLRDWESGKSCGGEE